MADQDIWKETLAGYRAKIVVWIDQAKDASLREQNREGVCSAIVDHWITAYSSNREDRADFLNEIRAKGIPQDIIDAQDVLWEQVKAHNDLLQSAKVLQNMKVDALTHKGSVERVKSSEKKLHSGEMTKYPAGSAIQPILQWIARTPGYTRLSMRPAKGGPGHVVGFEVRPDLAGMMTGTSFPNGLFELMDANLGLCVFRSARTMVEFFYLEMWKPTYKDRYPGCAFVVEHHDVASGSGLEEEEEDPVLARELESLMNQN